jgi:hypothetical protein
LLLGGLSIGEGILCVKLILFNLRILHDGCAFDIGSCQLQGLPLGLGRGGDPGVIGRPAAPEGLFDGVGDDLG